jgi:hypothetical protein
MLKELQQKRRKRMGIFFIILCFFIVARFFINNNTKVDSSDTTNENLEVATPTDLPTPTSAAISQPVNQTLDVMDEAGFTSSLTKITQALKAANASQLQSLITTDAIVGSVNGGQTGDAINKEEVTTWLNAHWNNNLQYVSHNYVDHFGYWEIVTTGWKDTPTGEVDFRLFRYDAQGKRSVTEGVWLIYAVLY